MNSGIFVPCCSTDFASQLNPRARQWTQRGANVAVYRVLPWLLLLGLSACVTVPTPPDTPEERCLALFADADRAVEIAGVRDQGPVTIEGFPYLRANRFLASFREDFLGDQQFATWVGHLAELDAVARELELQNLLARSRPEKWQREKLAECRQKLVRNLLADPTQRKQLLAAAWIPDDYVTAWRVAGLYPLAAPFVSLGVNRWQDESHKVFSAPLGELPVSGNLRRWRSASMPETKFLELESDPLGIPVPEAQQRQYLFRRFAPVWEVDVVDENDLPGTATWWDGPAIDAARPTQYEFLSYTRFGQEVLVQLNYVIWFRARPGDDIYAGRFDGLVWRVTLGPNGEPWLYDSIHNCGCYHTFIPSGHLRLRDDLPTMYFEPPLVPQQAPQSPIVLRISSGKHYLQRAYTAVRPTDVDRNPEPTAAVESLEVADYNRMRSLPADGGYRSFFGDYALVAGSERPERFLLWPMGVRSAGAMRQWGHQPVAFVGRRHFDDSRLIETLFERTER